MNVIFKILFLTLIVGTFVFARNGRKDVGSADQITKGKTTEHYWDNGKAGGGDDSLERKRSHKRRRKVRKPIKGLR